MLNCLVTFPYIIYKGSLTHSSFLVSFFFFFRGHSLYMDQLIQKGSGISQWKIDVGLQFTKTSLLLGITLVILEMVRITGVHCNYVHGNYQKSCIFDIAWKVVFLKIFLNCKRSEAGWKKLNQPKWNFSTFCSLYGTTS